MGINKVDYFGETLIDLTEDTVTADALKKGITAHAKNGERIVGDYETKLQSKSATPTKSAQTVKPDSGYDGLSQVSVGAIPSDYLDRFDLKYVVTGTFQPSSDVNTYTVTNSNLNGSTPKVIIITMTNANAYKPGISGKNDFVTSGFFVNLEGSYRGYTYVTYSGSVGYYNGSSVTITPKANGFTISTASGIAITAEKGYRYVCLG